MYFYRNFSKLPSLSRSDGNFSTYLTLKLENTKPAVPHTLGFTPQNYIKGWVNFENFKGQINEF